MSTIDKGQCTQYSWECAPGQHFFTNMFTAMTAAIPVAVTLYNRPWQLPPLMGVLDVLMWGQLIDTARYYLHADLYPQDSPPPFVIAGLYELVGYNPHAAIEQAHTIPDATL
jgi:hypothetical protein